MHSLEVPPPTSRPHSREQNNQQGETTGAWSTRLEGRVGHGSKEVVEKRRFRDACDTGWHAVTARHDDSAILRHEPGPWHLNLREAAEEGPHGEGAGAEGEKRQYKRQKETKHKQEGFQGKGKEEVVEKRKGPWSEGADSTRNAQRGRERAGRGREEAM
jgi:hypothetical protein